MQEFAAFFNAQAQPRRLVGFSKRGKAHYATPSAWLRTLTLPKPIMQGRAHYAMHRARLCSIQGSFAYKVCPRYEPKQD